MHLLATFFVLCLAAAESVGGGGAHALDPVDLGSVARFVIFSAAGITNISPSIIIGDIGTSPITGAALTGFGEGEVTGDIFTVDFGFPTLNVSITNSTLLGIAAGDLVTAYEAAKDLNSTYQNATDGIVGGNIGGLTLPAGLYNFASSVDVPVGQSVTLLGSATDVWVFQIGTAMNMNTGSSILLAGGARAENIFWQVGSAFTASAGVTIEGTIMAGTAATFAANVVINGRVLTRTASVTLSMITITRPDLIPGPAVPPPPPPPPMAEMVVCDPGTYTDPCGCWDCPHGFFAAESNSTCCQKCDGDEEESAPMNCSATTGLLLSTCGDGTIDDGEQCDGGYGCEACRCGAGWGKPTVGTVGCHARDSAPISLYYTPDGGGLMPVDGSVIVASLRDWYIEHVPRSALSVSNIRSEERANTTVILFDLAIEGDHLSDTWSGEQAMQHLLGSRVGVGCGTFAC
jgi:hypothetical protein